MSEKYNKMSNLRLIHNILELMSKEHLDLVTMMSEMNDRILEQEKKIVDLREEIKELKNLLRWRH